MQRIKYLFAACCLFPVLTGWINNTEHQKSNDFQKEKSLQAFEIVLDVITSPRCMNCHPSDDYPRQNDDQIKHRLGVERGPDDHGLPVLQCASCHQDENNLYSGVPGAPHWALAPKSMGWMGHTRKEIAKILLDENMNGGKNPAQLVDHMSNDKLVLWAWAPGHGRSVPPVPLDEFRTALKTWLDNGAHKPE